MIENEEDARAWIEARFGSDPQVGFRLQMFADLLTAENEHQNLVAGSSLVSLWQRHIADSAQLLCHLPGEGGTWLDAGTGAGFPGLVIAILAPSVKMILIENRVKRSNWLRFVTSELGLSNVEIWAGRIETFDHSTVDAISARAFAPLDRLVGAAARFSTSDTTWLLPKGRSAGDELQALSGWRHSFHVEQSLTDPDAGIIVGHLSGREGLRT